MSKIKKSILYVSVIKGNKSGQKYLEYESIFSKNGNLVEEKEFYKNGSVKRYYETISKKNNNIEITKWKTYNKNRKLISFIEHQEIYDDNKNLLNQKIIEDGNWTEEKYIYDRQNKLISKTMNDYKGNNYVTDINYDENGRENGLLFMQNNNLEVSVEITYKKNPKREISKTFNSYDALLNSSITYFDKNNFPSKFERYDQNKDLVSSSSYVYSELGLLESADFDKDQIITERISKTYDEKTNLINKSIIERYSKGLLIKKEISEWEYEFYDD